MVSFDEIFAKGYNYIWLSSIAGSILILVESVLNLENALDAWIGIGISIIVIVFVVLTRLDVHGSGLALGICAYFLILSPIGFNGFELGYLLILLGAVISLSGGLFTYTNYFVWVGIGAVVIDLIIFFVF